MVSSDIVRLFFSAMKNDEKPNVGGFLNSLIEKVGHSGTLIIPTFNWDFCSGKVFDYHNTPSKTGSLGTIALRDKRFLRTQHPIYSFAVYGQDQKLLFGMNNKSAYGNDSPFAYMDQIKAKNLIIDVELTNCFTFVHYVEQSSGTIKYRYLKNFSAPYIDNNGDTTVRKYSLLVRDLELDVVTDFRPIEEELKDRGAIQEETINGVPIKMVNLHACVPPILNDITNNNSRKICQYKGQNE